MQEEEVVVNEAIFSGDIEDLVLLYKKSLVAKNGEKTRKQIEENLATIKLHTGLEGNTFQEVLADHDQKQLSVLYEHDLPGLLQVIEHSKYWSRVMLKILEKKVFYPDWFSLTDIGRLGFLLFLNNPSSKQLALTIALLIQNDYDSNYDDFEEEKVQGFNGYDKFAFLKLCQEDNHPEFIDYLYYGELLAMAEGKDRSFFHTLFLQEEKEEIYAHAAQILFEFLSSEEITKINDLLYNDLFYFVEKVKARRKFKLLKIFRQTLAKEAENSNEKVKDIVDRVLTILK